MTKHSNYKEVSQIGKNKQQKQNWTVSCLQKILNNLKNQIVQK